MMTTGLKALLFAAGGATAAAGTAYVTGALDPWLGRTPAIVAALPETPATTPAQEAAPTEEVVPQPEEPAEVAEQSATPLLPTFDLLRVEPDGSMVVVGQAAPGATVEVLTGETVIAKTEASAEGEFVAVLDEPLAPGDYQIELRATSPDGEVLLSTQTAVVSIPEEPDGQVLALVEEPGEASNLITVPEAEVAAAVEPAEEPVAAPEDGVAAEPAPEAEPTEEVAVAEVEQEPAAEIAEEAVEEPATEEVAVAEPEEAPVAVEVAEAPAETEEAVPAATIPTVGVEAVEIEGDTIFVAGHAEPGRTVRVYIDETMLGDAVASDTGRFLVEAKRDLPVGDYIIRADLLDEDGSVLARAAVPFEREPGESVVAVAPTAPAEPAAPAVEPETEVPAAPESVPEEVATDPAPATESEEVAAETQPAVEAPQAEVEVASAPAEAEEAEATAPKLQRADGAVIIRRGDNLWRISRRVYGMGVRYSSIYLANQDQISDPHRIWPGQIFTVPGESAEGEPANMDAIADQAVLPDAPEGAVAQ